MHTDTLRGLPKDLICRTNILIYHITGQVVILKCPYLFIPEHGLFEQEKFFRLRDQSIVLIVVF